LKAAKKWKVEGKGVRESNGSNRVEWTKVKYTHSRDTLRNPLEHQLKY
jgi:hypothetical protein